MTLSSMWLDQSACCVKDIEAEWQFRLRKSYTYVVVPLKVIFHAGVIEIVSQCHPRERFLCWSYVSVVVLLPVWLNW